MTIDLTQKPTNDLSSTQNTENTMLQYERLILTFGFKKTLRPMQLYTENVPVKILITIFYRVINAHLSKFNKQKL